VAWHHAATCTQGLDNGDQYDVVLVGTFDHGPLDGSVVEDSTAEVGRAALKRQCVQCSFLDAADCDDANYILVCETGNLRLLG